MAAKTALAVHWGTFQLGDEAQDEPAQVLRKYERLTGQDVDFWTLQIGEGRAVPPRGTNPN